MKIKNLFRFTKKKIILTIIFIIAIVLASIFIFLKVDTYASPLNEALYKYELCQYNETVAMNDAILDRGGTALDTCVLFQANCLRAIGVDVPSGTAYTTDLATYLEAHGWVKETNLSDLQKGDLCFCGTTHVFLFMGWENYFEQKAYAMGDESYMFSSDYSIRSLDGQTGDSENDDTTQYKVTYYLKYVGSDKGTTTDNTDPSAIKDNLGRVSVDSSVGLYMMSSASDSSDVVALLDDNLVLYVLKSQDGWYEVYYNGLTGWVQSQYTTGLGNALATTSENIEDANSTTSS